MARRRAPTLADLSALAGAVGAAADALAALAPDAPALTAAGEALALAPGGRGGRGACSAWRRPGERTAGTARTPTTTRAGVAGRGAHRVRPPPAPRPVSCPDTCRVAPAPVPTRSQDARNRAKGTWNHPARSEALTAQERRNWPRCVVAFSCHRDRRWPAAQC